MISHPSLSLLFVMQTSPSGPAPLVVYLGAILHDAFIPLEKDALSRAARSGRRETV